MAFGNPEGAGSDTTEVMNEINMTPLVDVMLVLLVILLITLPVAQHAIQLELPRASAQPQAARPEAITLSVDAQGAYYLGQTGVSEAALDRLLQAEAAKSPQPEIHIRADQAVRYEFVVQAMARVRQAGLHRIAFVTEPRR